MGEHITEIQMEQTNRMATDPVELMERLAERFPDNGHSNELLASGVWLDPKCLIPTEDNARNPQPTDPDIIEFGKKLVIVQLNAVQARPHPTELGKFDLRAGSRRRAGTESAGIPVKVDIYDWDDATAFAVTMMENRDREDLNVLQEAKLCQTYLSRHTLEEATEFLGRSADWVRRRASLSRLTEEAIAYGSPDWTIGYWEALALLEPDAQREVISQSLCYTKVDDLTLRNLRNYCSYHTRSLGKRGLWPMDSGMFPGGPCSECTKRKLAVGYLPGFIGKDECDECLDKECYDKRLEAWTQYRVAKLREKNPDAVVLTDYRTKHLLSGVKGMTDRTWDYQKEAVGRYTEPVKVIIACDVKIKAETRYVLPLDPTDPNSAPEASPEDKRRWKAVKKAVVALQEHLDAASNAEESPISFSECTRYWTQRGLGKVPEIDVMLVAAVSFGLEGGCRNQRGYFGVVPPTLEVVFPLDSMRDEDGGYCEHVSPWHPINCIHSGSCHPTFRKTLDGAAERIFRSLCKTFHGRLHIDTLKAHADSALAEAKTVCGFLGLDWQAQYATPAGLED